MHLAGLAAELVRLKDIRDQQLQASSHAWCILQIENAVGMNAFHRSWKFMGEVCCLVKREVSCPRNLTAAFTI